MNESLDENTISCKLVIVEADDGTHGCIHFQKVFRGSVYCLKWLKFYIILDSLRIYK